MMAEKRRNLGRGLSALLGEDTSPAQAGGARQIAIEKLHPGRYQPRRTMGEAELQDLAQSIRELGVLQPILVREDPDRPGNCEIIAGERRWRAAQLAQLHEVPVLVKVLSNKETLEVALVENLQREDLSPLEEAVGLQRLMDEFGHTQEALAKAVGKSRSHVANMLRLLGLPDAVKAMASACARPKSWCSAPRRRKAAVPGAGRRKRMRTHGPWKPICPICSACVSPSRPRGGRARSPSITNPSISSTVCCSA